MSSLNTTKTIDRSDAEPLSMECVQAVLCVLQDYGILTTDPTDEMMEAAGDARIAVMLVLTEGISGEVAADRVTV